MWTLVADYKYAIIMPITSPTRRDETVQFRRIGVGVTGGQATVELHSSNGVQHSVVGPFLWPARRPGTPYQTTCEIRHVSLTVFAGIWKSFFSRFTGVHSALCDYALHKSTIDIDIRLSESIRRRTCSTKHIARGGTRRMAGVCSASIDNSNVIHASRTQRDESAPTTAGQRQWSIWSISDHHSLTSYIAVTACARHAGTADFCHSVTVIVIRQVGQLRLVKRNAIQYNKSIYNARMESVKFYYFSHTTVKKDAVRL